jgi:hypothetical protein
MATSLSTTNSAPHSRRASRISRSRPNSRPHSRRQSVITKTTTDDGARSLIQDETRRTDNLKDRFIGAIDQGTTSTRFIVFDGTGLPIASYQSEFRQIHEHSGYVNPIAVAEICGRY